MTKRLTINHFTARASFLLSWLTVAALAAFCGLSPAAAATYTYSTQARTINAGVLLLDSTQLDYKNNNNQFANSIGPDNPTPYFFYVLQQRPDIKPFGWNIINPLAPKTVTSDIQQRWINRTGVDLVTGRTVRSNMAAYWEVYLSKASVEDLLQYDVLVLSLRGFNNSVSNNYITRFSASDSEKLRRFVDGGGQLIVEDQGGAVISSAKTEPVPKIGLPINAPLFFDFQFNGTARGAYAQVPGLARHPILSSPYLLSNGELSSLVDNAAGGNVVSGFNTSNPPDQNLLSPVLNTGASVGAVYAGQLGAGQVVVDGLGVGTAITEAVGSSAYSAFTLFNVDTTELKFLANIISWSSAHPSEHKNSHQNAGLEDSLSSSVVPNWVFTTTRGSTALALPGAALQGGIAYVRDADGNLDAFNAFPGTDLSGTGNPDQGIKDYSTGTPYDEIWTAALKDTAASAPTVATVNGLNTNRPIVWVEGFDGKILTFDAATGKPLKVYGTGGSKFNINISTPTPAPSPTIYNGRLYAAQDDGGGNIGLLVRDFVGGSAYNADILVPISQNNTGETLVGPPSVGLVSENATSGSIETNDVVVYVPTTKAVYAVLVGARGENLGAAGGSSYTTKINSLNAGSATLDNMAGNPLRVYSLDNNGFPLPAAGPTATGTTITASGLTPPVYGDYDLLFANPPPAMTYLPTAQVASTGSQTPGSLPPNYSKFEASVAALDARGNAYFTVTDPGSTLGAPGNSSLYCVHETITSTPGAAIRWRWRMPAAADGQVADADGNNYTDGYLPVDDTTVTPKVTPHFTRSLAGFKFVGAPVVDHSGLVYALATDGVRAAVLCFAADNSDDTPDVYADLSQLVGNATPNITLSQPLVGRTTNEFGNTTIAANLPRYDPNNPGQNNTYHRYQNDFNLQTKRIELRNFGTGGLNATPNLSEPQAISVSANTGNGGASVFVPLHNNLVWYTIFDGSGGATKDASGQGVDNVKRPYNLTNPSPLAQVGDYLFFGGQVTDGITGKIAQDSTIFKVYDKPQTSAGLIGNDRFVAPNGTANQKEVFTIGLTNEGTIASIATASNGAMIVNGTNGVAGLAGRLTLVADNSRLMEVNADGEPVWIADSTTSTTLEGGANRFFDPASTAQRVTSHVDLNHPSTIAQLAANDYLVADTGNNRCVRFDRGGRASWELTQFNDARIQNSKGNDISIFRDFNTPANFAPKTKLVLDPGEAMTLNQPTSVKITRTYWDDTAHQVNGGPGQGTVVHYLIADSGNYRILEVVDVYDATGALVGVPHNLVWATHTYDKQSRQYRYSGADFYVDPTTGQPNVVALVTNTRVAGPVDSTTGQLDSATKDAPGGSIVLVNYDPLHALPNDGYLANTRTAFYASLLPSGKDENGNVDVNAPQVNGSPDPDERRFDVSLSSAPKLLQISNPRYLQKYSAKNGVAAPTQNFMFCDDNGAFDIRIVSGKLIAQWGFTRADYHNMVTQLGASPATAGTPIDASGTPFNRGPSPTNPSGLPFVPTCIQRTGSDQLTLGSNSQPFQRYLITQQFGQGEANTQASTLKLGGEVFEVSHAANKTLGTVNKLTGGFNGHTLSHFSSTGPLVNPSYAVRL